MFKLVKITVRTHELGTQMAEEEAMSLKHYVSHLIVQEAKRTASGITKEEKLRKRLSEIQKAKAEIEKEEVYAYQARLRNFNKGVKARQKRAEEAKKIKLKERKAAARARAKEKQNEKNNL